MTNFPKGRFTRDKEAYREGADGGTDRRTHDIEANEKLSQVITNGSLLAGIAWDYVDVTYPTATTEVYVFKNGGSGGTTTATVTITYTTAAKKDLSNVERVVP